MLKKVANTFYINPEHVDCVYTMQEHINIVFSGSTDKAMVLSAKTPEEAERYVATLVDTLINSDLSLVES